MPEKFDYTKEEINNEKQLRTYLHQIEAAALKIVSDPSTKKINKKISKWAMKISAKAFIQGHRIDLQ